MTAIRSKAVADAIVALASRGMAVCSTQHGDLTSHVVSSRLSSFVSGIFDDWALVTFAAGVEQGVQAGEQAEHARVMGALRSIRQAEDARYVDFLRQNGYERKG